MIQVNQNALVELVCRQIRKFGGSKEGTYNPADPTRSERGKAEFLLGGELYMEARFFDGTWGVEFSILTRDGEGEEHHSGYFSRNMGGAEGDWHRVEGELFKHLRNILLADHMDVFSQRDRDRDFTANDLSGLDLEEHPEGKPSRKEEVERGEIQAGCNSGMPEDDNREAWNAWEIWLEKNRKEVEDRYQDYLLRNDYMHGEVLDFVQYAQMLFKEGGL